MLVPCFCLLLILGYWVGFSSIQDIQIEPQKPIIVELEPGDVNLTPNLNFILDEPHAILKEIHRRDSYKNTGFNHLKPFDPLFNGRPTHLQN